MNRSAAAWLVLAAALAVPGFLFYRWWSHLDAESKKQLNMKVRKRLPADETLFKGAPDDARLTNPMAQDAAVSTAPAALSAGATEAALAAAQVPLSPQDALILQAQGLGAAPAAADPAASTEAVHVEPVLEPLAAITRDPTLSPYDVTRLEQLALEKAIREQELRDELSIRTRPKVRYEPDPRTKVELQGIVSTEEGEKAIVNGEVVGAGDLISGIKVLQITPRGVVFIYKGKRFTKTISK